MNVIEKGISDVKPYEKNPRKNDAAVSAVANSIREFGFKVPIVIDKNGTIIAGHTRSCVAVGIAKNTLRDCGRFDKTTSKSF